jgi:hypothetical protein
MLREEHRLSIFGKRVLGNIHWPMRETEENYIIMRSVSCSVQRV